MAGSALGCRGIVGATYVVTTCTFQHKVFLDSVMPENITNINTQVSISMEDHVCIVPSYSRHDRKRGVVGLWGWKSKHAQNHHSAEFYEAKVHVLQGRLEYHLSVM
jgi:hypothetical protein